MAVYFFGRAKNHALGALKGSAAPVDCKFSHFYDERRKVVKFLTDGRNSSLEYAVKERPTIVEVFDVDDDKDPDVVLTFSDGTKKLIEGINADLFCLQATDSYIFGISDLPVLRLAEKDPRFTRQAGRMISQLSSLSLTSDNKVPNFRGEEPTGVTSSRKIHPSFACISTGEYPKRSVANIRYMWGAGIEPMAINSWQAIDEMARLFQKDQMPGLVGSGRKNVTILYPGSGSHIAPLEAAFHFLRNTPELESVNFTYTEISSDDAPRGLLRNLKFLKKEGLVSAVTQTVKKYNNGGSDYVFSMKIETPHGQKTINLTLALQRCTDALCGSAYYLPEYFDAADIVLIHDIGGEDAAPEDFYKELPQAIRMLFGSAWRQGGSQKIVWLEDGADLGENTYVRGWVTEFMQGYKKVNLPYGCRYLSENVAGGRGGDHMGKAIFAGAVIRIEPALFQGFSEVQFEALMQTVTDMDYFEDGRAVEGAMAESAERRWEEKEINLRRRGLERNTKFVSAASRWEEIAWLMQKNGGDEAQWRFRKAVLSRMETKMSEALFKNPEALVFLENTVAIALADSGKFDDLFGWMERGVDFPYSAGNQFSRMQAKLNLLDIFFTIAGKKKVLLYDKFIRAIRPKFEKFVVSRQASLVMLFCGDREIPDLRNMRLIRYSREPFSVTLCPERPGATALSSGLEATIKMSHYGRLLFGTDSRWRFFFDSEQEKKAYNRMRLLRQQLKWTGQYITITVNGKKGQTLNHAPDLF